MISLNNVPPVSTRYLAVWVLRGDVPIWVEGIEAPACHRHAIRVFARSALSLVMLSWQLIPHREQDLFGNMPVEQSPVNFVSNLFQLTGGSAERTLLVTASPLS